METIGSGTELLQGFLSGYFQGSINTIKGVIWFKVRGLGYGMGFVGIEFRLLKF